MAEIALQLTQLAKLKNDGVLSEREFQAAKAKLLGTARREICTVELVHIRSRWNSTDQQFRAVATGPSGRYIIAQSPVWTNNGRTEKENTKRYNAALEAILKDLSAGGWQVLEEIRLSRYPPLGDPIPIYTYERYL